MLVVFATHKLLLGSWNQDEWEGLVM